MTEVCPCCGRPWEGPGKTDAVQLVKQLSRGLLAQNIVAVHLAENLGVWVHRADLVRLCYAHRIDGGPENPEGNIAVYLNRWRKRLHPYGLLIEGKSHMGSRMLWARDVAMSSSKQQVHAA